MIAREHRRRVTLPGSRLVGGRAAWIRTDLPHDLDEPWGTLAAAARVRDVDVPAGSTVAVDPDFDDVTVTLGAAATVRGVPLPAGTVVRFAGRVLGFAGLHLAPRHVLALPWLWWRRRRDARALDVTLAAALAVGGRTFAAGARVAIDARGQVTGRP